MRFVMIVETGALEEALKRHFGFDAFRPYQEAIVRDVLAGRDVFALLPTGGGKSLCYQLPALLRPGLTVVISPLIALMKDQVDALTTAGIAATFLNSSLPPEAVCERVAGLARGVYQLLYVAPERLVLPGFLADLERWGVAHVAVDEAHCISEWGHDFRPDYRRIADLRRQFPAVPFMALTATATHRVRDDIVERLALRAPALHVGSFNRPNLTYRVAHRRRGADALIAWLRARPEEDAGIVYVGSRAAADDLAERLSAAGIAAVPYHAGLDTATRAKHQERFRRDATRVVCATVAFGMGIDKPNVRFVVHYDVPRSIEGYYQETGRAGRDGLPAECLLFFSYADVARLERFATEKDEAEQAVAREQLERMTRYAYSNDCRRRDLLAYFGEVWSVANCGACDNCLEPRPAIDATVDAQKLLSCIERIRRANGFGVGIGHVVDVLLGVENEKVWRWNHDRLTTFGIGKDRTRGAWRGLADELVRLGLIAVDAARFNTVALTTAGKAALTERTPIEVREAPARGEKRRRAAPADPGGAYDAEVFRALRDLRKELADERDVPAYVIFSDAVLRAMARELPATLGALRAISGVGDKKLSAFGDRFLAEIARASERVPSR